VIDPTVGHSLAVGNVGEYEINVHDRIWPDRDAKVLHRPRSRLRALKCWLIGHDTGIGYYPEKVVTSNRPGHIWRRYYAIDCWRCGERFAIICFE